MVFPLSNLVKKRFDLIPRKITGNHTDATVGKGEKVLRGQTISRILCF